MFWKEIRNIKGKDEAYSYVGSTHESHGFKGNYRSVLQYNFHRQKTP